VVTLSGTQTPTEETLTAPTADEYRVAGTEVVGSQGCRCGRRQRRHGGLPGAHGYQYAAGASATHGLIAI
jgi:hypothetical protein